jgi:MFS family permease
MKDRRKWGMLGFAFLATVINYLSRQTLSVMAPVLMLQFCISATSYSHIIFAFMLAYTCMNGVSGRLLDRLGTKIGYGLTIAFWSGAELLHAFSAGALSLGFFQFLLGIGEAGNYPAGVKLIAEWFPVEERSHASGIFNSGASIGAILAPPLLAWIVLASGWRTAFVMIGLLGFVWLAGWLGVYQEPHAPLRRINRSAFHCERCCDQDSYGSSLCPRCSAILCGIFTPFGSHNILKWFTHFHCGRSARRPGYRSLRRLSGILREVLCSADCCARAPRQRLRGAVRSSSFPRSWYLRYLWETETVLHDALLLSRLRPLDIPVPWQICWLSREMCSRQGLRHPSGASPVWGPGLEE